MRGHSATFHLLALSLAVNAAAGEEGGVWVGPWMLQPSVELSVQSDSNVFRRSAAGRVGPVSDVIRGAAAEIAAQAQLGSGKLAVALGERWSRYGSTFENTLREQRGALDLELRPFQLYQVRVRGEWVDGVAETQEFDEGGEAIFTGAGFTLKRLDVEAGKEKGSVRGFWVRLGSSALRFDSGRQVPFFDYDRWEIEIGRTVFVGTAGSLALVGRFSRADHFCPPGGEAGFCSFGEHKFREEERRELALTFERELGGRRLELKPGWGRVAFGGPGDAGTDYNGPLLRLAYTERRARGTSFMAALQREVFASFFVDNNFYVSDRIEAEFGFAGPTRLQWRIGARVSRNRYGAVVEEPGNPIFDGLRRRDRLAAISAAMVISLAKLWDARLWVLREERDSRRLDLEDYRATVLGASLSWGWK